MTGPAAFLAPLAALDAEADIVIVGADLSGAVVASALARAGRRVTVLDRRDLARRPEDPAARLPFGPGDGVLASPRLPAALRTDEARVAAALARARRMGRTAAGEAADGAALALAYLHDAVAHGALVFGSTEVSHLGRAAGGAAGSARWLVSFDLVGAGRAAFEAPRPFLRATLVVLAAGAGAAEILVASRSGALTFPISAPGAGCPMGEDAAGGVVDHRGRVFAGHSGAAVHEDLLVVGPSTVPASVGSVGALGLAALAERSVALLAADRGWTVPDGPPQPLPAQPFGGPALQFTEAMRGFFSTRVTDADFDRGVRLGREEGSSFAFVLTLVADPAAALLEGPGHPARTVGTVEAPALSPQPLVVTGGDFNLFVDQPGEPGTRRMKYRMRMLAQDGRVFFMDGYKVIRDDEGLDVWPDTTTLYITVFAGASDEGPPIGRGVLRIRPADFLRQLRTLQILRTRSLRERARVQAGFFRLFLGTLFDTYVGAELGLPAARGPGGPMRAKAAVLGWTLGGAAALAAALWPFRPALLRQQPEIAPVALVGPPPTGTALPADVAALRLFPQHLAGLDLGPGRYRLETVRLQTNWTSEALVQTHGGLADIPLHPPDVRVLRDGPTRRAFVTMNRLRDPEGRVVGLGSQLETVALDSRPWRHVINAHTEWTLLLPGQGILFLSQKEGGTQLASLQAEAKRAGRPWRGVDRVNHTLGPLPEGQGVVIGGTGAFAGVVGAFREYNTATEVPAQGDAVGITDFEIHLLRAPRLSGTDARGAAPGAGPRASRPRVRRLEIDLARDVVYWTRGPGRTEPLFPGGLGAVPDEALAGTTIFLARLRDERGEVVGLAGAGRTPAAPGDHGHWTFVLPGEGALFVAAQGGPAPGPGASGFLGPRPAAVIGGSGLYAGAMGTAVERWPAAGAAGGSAGSGVVAIELRLGGD